MRQFEQGRASRKLQSIKLEPGYGLLGLGLTGRYKALYIPSLL